jgi:hypothetical protein
MGSKSISIYLHINTIHDNLITGISTVDKNNIVLSINEFSNLKKIGDLVFYNVKQCRFDDFRLGNIILDITILDIKDINDELCYLFDISEKDMGKDWIVQIKENIALQKLILVQLTTTYGVHGIILCEQVAFNSD